MSPLLGLDVISIFWGVLVFLVIWKLVQKDEKAALIDKMPGPVALPVLGNIFQVLEPKEKFAEGVLKRRKKFGPVFRMWLGSNPAVILSRAEEIEVILKSTIHSKKSFAYRFMESWLGTGLLTSYGNKWAAHRKLITPTFHFSVLQNFIEIFQGNSDILIEKLAGKAETGEEFDLYPLITLCALDIICETAMGTKVNAQTQEENDYVKSVYKLSQLTVHRISRIWLHPNSLFKMTPSGQEYFKHLKIVQNFTEDVIKSRRKALEREGKTDFGGEEKRKLAFLDLLLKANISESVPLTVEELREEVDTFMFEGHDTTAAAMNWTLFLLGHHPKIQENVYAEVKAIFDGLNGDSLTISHLAEMKLLERVIKESLRIFPSVFSIGRTLEEDVKLGNYLVPKGVMAIISIYSLHRDPLYFKDPEVFDPDRFLPENSAGRHPYAYIPFSAGPRNCIGQKFAMFEEKVVLSNLLYQYKFESVEKVEKIIRMPELILRPRPGLKMKISKR